METSELLKKVRQIEIKTRGLSNNIFGGGSSGEYCTMGETLMQRRRVEEEGLRIVNSCC